MFSKSESSSASSSNNSLFFSQEDTDSRFSTSCTKRRSETSPSSTIKSNSGSTATDKLCKLVMESCSSGNSSSNFYNSDLDCPESLATATKCLLEQFSDYMMGRRPAQEISKCTKYECDRWIRKFGYLDFSSKSALKNQMHQKSLMKIEDLSEDSLGTDETFLTESNHQKVSSSAPKIANSGYDARCISSSKKSKNGTRFFSASTHRPESTNRVFFAFPQRSFQPNDYTRISLAINGLSLHPKNFKNTTKCFNPPTSANVCDSFSKNIIYKNISRIPTALSQKRPAFNTARTHNRTTSTVVKNNNHSSKKYASNEIAVTGRQISYIF